MSKLAIAYMHRVVVGNKFFIYAYQPIFHLHLRKLRLLQWYFNATWSSMFAHRALIARPFILLFSRASCTSCIWQFLKTSSQIFHSRILQDENEPFHTDAIPDEFYACSFQFNSKQPNKKRAKKISIEHEANTPFLALATKSLLKMPFHVLVKLTHPHTYDLSVHVVEQFLGNSLQTH